MTNAYAMPILEKVIAKARAHKDAPTPDAADYDNWIAWVIVNELRLAGWKIVPPEGFSFKDSLMSE